MSTLCVILGVDKGYAEVATQQLTSMNIHIRSFQSLGGRHQILIQCSTSKLAELRKRQPVWLVYSAVDGELYEIDESTSASAL